MTAYIQQSLILPVSKFVHEAYALNACHVSKVETIIGEVLSIQLTIDLDKHDVRQLNKGDFAQKYSSTN